MVKIKDGFQGSRMIVLSQLIVKTMEEDPITAVLHTTDIGYYPKAENHQRDRQIPINQYVLIYCIKGEGWYKIGEHCYTVTSNQYFILPKGKPHSYGTTQNNPWTIYWIHFKGTLAAHYARYATTPISLSPQIHSRISNRIDIFEEIYNTLNASYAITHLRYATTLLHHFLGTLQNIQQYRTATPTDTNDIVSVAIHYMKENLEKKLTLNELAEYIGYSPSHFSALFKQTTGHAPLAYFNLLKIQQSCLLLNTTDMKINQICFKIGIEDTYYFSRLFNKLMGMPPKEYRKQNKITQ